ncbi:haloacid dehalogenase [Propionigenium maris DSM 9537]|uniref:Haloacid dehalogenase n=1 Tax=Propionigenium maris DSM 9537 TaxID=1123000 RepID=A0A9W6GM48_9FUSO|nr:HAD family hydrolase [Propionigenium maris]GLI56241.1 haloacid dehalogenase [Propionigenium maris DSM 9537]
MKIISFDLDGTLLRDNKTVSDFSKNILLKCREAGKTLIFNSARPPRLIYEVLPEEFHGDIIISSNGALINKGEETMFKNFISPEDTRVIIEYLEGNHPKIYFSVEQGRDSYTSFYDEAYNKEMFALKVDFREVDLKGTPKFLVRVGAMTEEELERFIQTLPPSCAFLRTDGGEFAQIMARGNTKLSGIKKIVDMKNYHIDDVIAFGDDHNDFEIIRDCGVGVAMGNAETAIKEVADHVTLTNEEDGVAKFLFENVIGA